MKISRVLLAIVLIALAFGTYQSASATSFTLSSAYQVYNLEATQASISIYFYNQDGSIKATIPDTIPGNQSKTYFVVSQLTGTFNGSIVISSTTQVASIANVQSAGLVANASYVAANTGGSPIQIPLLMKNNSGYNTWFNVQNTGLSNASVSVNYSDGTSVGPFTVAKGASRTFDQLIETHSLPFFAGTVTANQPVAVTVIEETSSVLFAFNGFIGSSTNPVLPLVHANNSGFTTGIALKNDGGSSTNITMSYTPSPGGGNGTACTETQTVPAGQMRVFALAAFFNGANSTCTPLARFVGASKVTTNSASMPLTVVVNQHIQGKNGSAYSASNPALATSKVVFPLIMDRNSNFWTGFNVQNVGTLSTNVTCTFTNSGLVVGPVPLSPLQALNHLQYGKIASGYVGAGTCTASGGDAKIIGVLNEDRIGGTTDLMMTYEGINVTP
jgi:hypothetical protein